MLAAVQRSSAPAASPTAHPSYETVSSLCDSYPTQAAAVLQTYLDLTHAAAAWQEVEPCELRGDSGRTIPTNDVACLDQLRDQDAQELVEKELQQWKQSGARLGVVDAQQQHSDFAFAALMARRKDTDKYEVIIPLSVSHHLEPSQIEQLFRLVGMTAAQRTVPGPVESAHVLLSIIAQDSSLVYYRLSKGMVKPVN